MLLQAIAQNYPNLVKKVFERKEIQNALNTFSRASQIPAYKKILYRKGISPEDILGISDFEKLPILDKENYIKKFPLSERVSVDMCKHYTIERSSGYSGEPQYWPRVSGQDDGVGKRLTQIFNLLFQTDQKRTLVVNTFALGTWIAGVKFARLSLNQANSKESNMTVVNVGIDEAEVIDVIFTFHQFYDQILLVGYNPFVKDVLEVVTKKKFPFKKCKIHLLVGGEPFSEEWRDYVADLIESPVDDFDAKIVSGYSAADLGADLGFEQPISIFFRRLLVKHEFLREKVFGKGCSEVPMIFQYSPVRTFIESVNKELILTMDSASPLVRYNLHDLGGKIDFKDMMDYIGEVADIGEVKRRFRPNPLPLLYLYGRSDGTLQVFGLNVYIENIKTAISTPEVQKFLTGKFFVESIYDKKMSKKFSIVCETNSKTLAQKNSGFIREKIVQRLRNQNREYDHAYEKNPRKVSPNLSFISPSEYKRKWGKTIKVKYK